MHWASHICGLHLLRQPRECIYCSEEVECSELLRYFQRVIDQRTRDACCAESLGNFVGAATELFAHRFMHFLHETTLRSPCLEAIPSIWLAVSESNLERLG